MPIYKVVTRWTGLGKSPKYSIMYYDGSEATVADAVASTRALWDVLKGSLSTTISAQVLGEVRVYNEITGDLISVNSAADAAPVTGTVSGEVAADATQILIRWRTATVVGGRLLQGRQYVPGVPVAVIDDGNLKGTNVAGMTTDIAAWLLPGRSLVVWHRPTPAAPAGGSVGLVTTGSVWAEFAVQRRRRG